jgi:hypothetical protein
LNEWLLLNAKWEIVQLYHGEFKLCLNEMMIAFSCPTHILMVLVH